MYVNMQVLDCFVFLLEFVKKSGLKDMHYANCIQCGKLWLK